MADYRELQKQLVDQLRIGASGLDGRASVVPMRADYRHDPAQALTAVVFVPAKIGREIRRAIIEPLQAIEPEHYYYPLESLHLTVKNIRTIHCPPRFTAADAKRVAELFGRLIPPHCSFSVSLEELAPLTTSLALIGYADEQLKKLVHVLDTGLNEIGLPDDKRYLSDQVFFGNVTVCRYVRRPSPKFLQAVEAMAHVYQRELRIEAVHLITCNAVCAPETRRIIAVYNLKSRKT